MAGSLPWLRVLWVEARSVLLRVLLRLSAGAQIDDEMMSSGSAQLDSWPVIQQRCLVTTSNFGSALGVQASILLPARRV